MAKQDEYLEEAYQTLLKLSADEKKQLEYEARDKALRDYNSQMQSARRQGQKQGQKQGKTRINTLNRLLAENNRADDILKAARDSNYQDKLMKEFGL